MNLIEYINHLISYKFKKLLHYEINNIKNIRFILNKKSIFKLICKELNIPTIDYYYILNSIEDIDNINLKNKQCIIKKENSNSCEGIYYKNKEGQYYVVKTNEKIKKSVMMNNLKKSKNIIIEEYLEDKYKYKISNNNDSVRLTDFKLFYFYGKLFYYNVFNKNVSDKYGCGHTNYSYEHKKILVDDNCTLNFKTHYDYNYNIRDIEKIKKYIENLSNIYLENIPFVRLDFYITNKGIKFGEITYTSDKGHYSYILSKYLGNILDRDNVLYKMENFIKYNDKIFNLYRNKYIKKYKLEYINVNSSILINILNGIKNNANKKEKLTYIEHKKKIKEKTWIEFLEELNIINYQYILEKEEIMSEKDLLQLREDDLIELGFKLGSRNRILSWKLENICKNI